MEPTSLSMMRVISYNTIESGVSEEVTFDEVFTMNAKSTERNAKKVEITPEPVSDQEVYIHLK